MNTWQDRLLELLKHSDLKTMTELCRVAGIATSTFSTALKGSHTPKRATLDKVARVLGTTTEYLLEGEENEAPALVNEVPLLSAEQITGWLNLSLKLSSIGERVRPPEPVHKLCFSWRVDTVDMTPFTLGSTVVIDPDFDFVRRHPKERMYVLAVRKRPVVHQVSFNQISDLVEESLTARKRQSMTPEYEQFEHHAALVELAKTVCGYELLSTERRTYRSLDFNEYQIVGRVKYSMQYY